MKVEEAFDELLENKAVDYISFSVDGLPIVRGEKKKIKEMLENNLFSIPLLNTDCSVGCERFETLFRSACCGVIEVVLDW